MVIIAILFLVIFGPSKLPQMARDAGRLMTEARRSIDEFKEELTSAADEDDRSPARKTTRDRPKDRPKKDPPEKNGRVSDEEEEYDL